MARRKYRFKDRAEAESEYRKVSNDAHMNCRLSRALYSGNVEWLHKAHPYRIGVFDTESMGGAKVVLVFHPKCNSEPSIDVWSEYDSDEFEWREKVVRNAGYAENSESRALAECLEAVRSKLHVRKSA